MRMFRSIRPYGFWALVGGICAILFVTTVCICMLISATDDTPPTQQSCRGHGGVSSTANNENDDYRPGVIVICRDGHSYVRHY